MQVVHYAELKMSDKEYIEFILLIACQNNMHLKCVIFFIETMSSNLIFLFLLDCIQVC